MAQPELDRQQLQVVSDPLKKHAIHKEEYRPCQMRQLCRTQLSIRRPHDPLHRLTQNQYSAQN